VRRHGKICLGLWVCLTGHSSSPPRKKADRSVGMLRYTAVQYRSKSHSQVCLILYCNICYSYTSSALHANTGIQIKFQTQHDVSLMDNSLVQASNDPSSIHHMPLSTVSNTVPATSAHVIGACTLLNAPLLELVLVLGRAPALATVAGVAVSR
jgi:hypothetical protein